MPVWVKVGRIIIARGSHAGVGRQADRQTNAGEYRGKQEEACSHTQLGWHTEAGRW
jgi:hypothetical protein